MSGPGARQEVEIKLRVDDAPTGRRLLRQAGFRVSRRRAYEDNLLFDTPERALRSQGVLLRLRRSGPHSTLTFKGPATAGKHKSRLELETTVASASTLQDILILLRFAAVFRYEKYRTEYRCKYYRVLATLDETPIGVFIELEGKPLWIDRTARRLGFGEVSYITDSYAGLYQTSRKPREGKAWAMVFPSVRV